MAIHQLRPHSTHILCRANDAICQRLGVVCSCITANVHIIVTRAITNCCEQRSIGTEDQLARAVRFMQQRHTGFAGFAYKDYPARWINRIEARADGRIARDAHDRSREVLIGGRVVTTCSKIHQVVPINRVHQVDAPVAEKIRIKGESQEAMIAPVAHFCAEVDEWAGQAYPVLHDPHFAVFLPYVPSVVRVEREAYRRLPTTHYERVVETYWNRLRTHVTDQHQDDYAQQEGATSTYAKKLHGKKMICRHKLCIGR